MYCRYCGYALTENTYYCTECGALVDFTADNLSCAVGGQVGYSSRIHDPAFAQYLKNTSRWSAMFSGFLAFAAIVGFTIYGETSHDMDNPQAFYIGLGIGGMFLVIALYSVITRKRSKTWDGVVENKIIRKKNRRQNTGNNDYYINYYTEYTVIVRDERGKKHRITTEDDDTLFNYYKIGERVRHHAGLNSYEKYDKSQDSIIFCSACGTLCDISDDVCYRCKCPLLK